jgi:tetratricopeptide (TPR) repeat protein
MRNRAKTYFKQKNYPAAIKVLETALELAENMDDPTLTTQILYQLGLTYFACKLYRKCLKRLKLSLHGQTYPSYEPDIYYHIGLAYARLEKFEKSIFPFTRCIERIPTDVIYMHERAKAHQMIDMHDEAVKDFD